MASAGDDAEFAGPRRDADEHGLETKRSKPQADLIVFGHAVAGKRPPVLHRGELPERPPRNRAADAGERDGRADRLPDDQFLDVSLGEFVAIMPRDPAGMRVRQWEDRQLDHRSAVEFRRDWSSPAHYN